MNRPAGRCGVRGCPGKKPTAQLLSLDGLSGQRHSITFWIFDSRRRHHAILSAHSVIWVSYISIISSPPSRVFNTDIIWLTIHIQTSPVVQWIGICLPMQGDTGLIPSLGKFHICWGTPKPKSQNYWADVQKLLKPMRLEPVLHNCRGHCRKPAHCKEESSVRCNYRKSTCSKKKKRERKKWNQSTFEMS